MIFRVRFHGRGGQGGKTASRILGDAAFNDGLNVQDSPLYGAERRGAPVMAFTRISDEEIEERGHIFDPDVVIVMDETLLQDYAARPIDGLRRGGVVFVNTRRVDDAVPVGSARKDIRVVALDLTGYALEALDKPILSAAAAAAAARLVSVVSERSLLRAVATELQEIGIGGAALERNLELAKKVYNELPAQELKTEDVHVERRIVPLEVIIGEDGLEDITSPGNSGLRLTGNWRVFRPKIDYDRCTKCMVCYAYCPESAMLVGADGRLSIDYDNCKGCLICMRECPPRAITTGREVTAG